MKSVCHLLPVLLACAAAIPLPTYIKPCKRGPQLNKCAVINGNAAIPYMIKGEPKLKIPSLDPIVVSRLSIKENSAKSIALNLTLIDMNIRHLSSAKLVDSNIDLNKRKVVWKIDVPVVSIDFHYEIDGKFLVLPIRGKGPGLIDMEKVKIEYTLEFDLKKIKGVEHGVITNSDVRFVTDKMKIRLDNLFDGNKGLGDSMNQVMNENWRELVAQVGPPVAKAIALALQPIVDRIVSQVPYNQIFPL